MKWLSLHIGGQKWSVFLVSPKSKHLWDPDSGKHNAGFCQYDKCSIYIARDLGEEAREDVLLHELLHALLYVTGGEKVYDCDHEKDEQLVSALTPTLHRVLKDLGFRFPRYV